MAIRNALVPRWERCSTALLALALGMAPSSAWAQTAAFTTEQVYTALIGPNLDQTGRLTPERADNIRQVALRLLNVNQQRELEVRLAALTSAPASIVPTAAVLPPPELGHPNAFDGAPPAVNESEPKRETLLDNLSIFGALDGGKQPQDLGINAHMGGRLEANLGFPIWEKFGIGGQIGTGYDFRNNGVHVMDQLTGTDSSDLNFYTVGIFQRSSWGINWAVAYDFLDENYYDHLHVGQWRGQVGYQVRCQDEVGVWGTARDRGDSTVALGTPINLQPLAQANVFWKHTWANQAQTSVWLGIAEGHSHNVLTISTEPPTNNVLTYGAEVFVPLSRFVALYGAANFHTPADSGTIDAFFGVALYPGGSAYGGRSRRFAPLLPVADSPFFAVDAR